MAKILYAEIMMLCILFLAVIYYNDTKSTHGPILTGQKIFHRLLLVNILAMVFDMLSVIYDGTDYSFSHAIVTFSVFLYYLLHSFVGCLYLLFIDFSLYPDKKRFDKRLPVYIFPSLVMAVIDFFSIWTGWFFKIDQANTYHRGPIYMLPAVIGFGYVIFTIGLTITWWSRNKADYASRKELYLRSIIVPIIPCIGAVLQVFLPGSASTLPFSALALFMLYASMQNGQMSKDHLTGLYNRAQLETVINYQIRNLKEGRYFFLILLDLDRFKAINDTYGHIVGDDALIEMANILRSNCKRKKDYVSRLGGDEFVIIGQCLDRNMVEKIVERLQAAVDEFNANSKKVYKLAFSAGYTICDGTTDATLDTLINEADQRMYRLKKEKKRKRN